ncbi:MAG TPA: tRNA pseudouridine(55) synthase TruB [Chloroflexota bacterium]|nr:tRNA pseudouridine(55) synthase TruB [Chloroflexota bacterium]
MLVPPLPGGERGLGGEGMDALYNVFKPRGPTSHDVVARLRRASGTRRIGHAGTLDPLAEGVLVVATGQATRLIEYLSGADKAYLAEVTLGVETDTYDAEGQVVAERSTARVGPEEVEAALARFRGTIEQRPPAHSAISVGGQRLYTLARKGQSVEVPTRTVEITHLELVAWAPPVVRLHVECSKGTYVRSLAHDLGRALGCGGHLSGLVRTRVGPFRARDATPLEELEALMRAGTWQGVAIPPDAAVAHLPAVTFDHTAAQGLLDGRSVSPPVPGEGERVPPSGTLGRAYDADGRFIAIVRLSHREPWGPRPSRASGPPGARHEPPGCSSAASDSGRGAYRPVWRPEKVFRQFRAGEWKESDAPDTGTGGSAAGHGAPGGGDDR